ncbi:Mitochondrial Protein Translocase (MPT) Family [Phytophthora cinnamomi]|uniref:Mitochondrial Protein Translocase (MPT) Family n=1 Tax=Phytophthora cinnamomi TaxID=4785 RepID=UPI00355954B7|nr:Mitochondrial Protein Translocase (MPT) Family [Phytophthora cinnamomi]
MALALRFAEEGEFSSRACDVSLSDAPDAAPSKAIFRWSRAARQVLRAHAQVHVQTLVVALPGPAQQFVRQFTRDWVSVGTLVTTDQLIHPCNLQATPSAGVILAKKGLKEQDNTLAVLVGQDVPAAASWAWLKTLKQHVEAEEVVCLDTQLSTVYADQYSDADKLRMLASSSVTDEMKTATPVRPLEVPQFVTGIPAALLTDGELRKRPVQVFVSLRDVSTTAADVVRSFLPLVASSSSVLAALERPLFFQPTGEATHEDRPAGSLNVLYTCVRARGHPEYCWFRRTMDHQQQQRSASARQFSTRFLPSDGIPEYNALLDTNLGKRREFLLGNRHSLELMQQTGVIERVESQPDNPNQYVVHIAEKSIHRRKRLPPRSASGPLQLPGSQTMAWRQSSASCSILEGYDRHGSSSLRRGSSSSARLNTVDDFAGTNGNDSGDLSIAKKVNAATLKGLSRSYSSNTVLTTSKPVLKSSAGSRLALFGSTKCSALLESSGAPGSYNFSKHRAASEVTSSHVPEMRQRSRSAVPAVLGSTFDELKKKGGHSKRSVVSTAGVGAPQTTVKGTVEYLLESDATFMTQIRIMKEHLTALENTKAYLDTEIGCLRRKLRGVNAVRENDVAVAHCSSIMQHRLSKAEEEFMKLVTQQQEVKKDVDRVRRELLSLRKVRHKLQEDIEDVAQANQSYEERIHTSKVVRNQLSEELSELERRAEVELEAQRLNLPPEDAVVVDVAKLMGAVQERNLSAFRVLQNSMGFENLASFEQQFTAAEEQLLSKYKANLALSDEVAALEKELAAVNNEKKANRASARGVIQANEKMERDIQTRIQTARTSIRSYNELRELRNREHAKLRGIMLRCLDALQVDIGGSDLPENDGTNSSGGAHAKANAAGSSQAQLAYTGDTT